MPTIAKVADSIPQGDRTLIRAFPKIAKRITNEVDEMDRAELEGFLKLLPGAIERHESRQTVKEVLDTTIYAAITQLAASFTVRPDISANPESKSISNTDLEDAEAEVSDSTLDNQQGAEIDPTYSLTKSVTSELVSGGHSNLSQVTSATRPEVTRVSNKDAHPDANSETEGRSRVRSGKGMPRRKQGQQPVIET